MSIPCYYLTTCYSKNLFDQENRANLKDLVRLRIFPESIAWRSVDVSQRYNRTSFSQSRNKRWLTFPLYRGWYQGHEGLASRINYEVEAPVTLGLPPKARTRGTRSLLVRTHAVRNRGYAARGTRSWTWFNVVQRSNAALTWCNFRKVPCERELNAIFSISASIFVGAHASAVSFLPFEEEVSRRPRAPSLCISIETENRLKSRHARHLCCFQRMNYIICLDFSSFSSFITAWRS